jgi:sugar phosphate isomerase/epimerase
VRRIGFSTGAVAKGDFREAIRRLQEHGVSAVELSALRLNELKRLTEALADLDLSSFDFVSFHAPSRFGPADEPYVVRMVESVAERGVPVVVHPDVIFTDRRWAQLGGSLLIENMDKRKDIGRTAADLSALFDRFPAARFCFDIGHARQVDPTMTEARLILEAVGHRLAEVHMSEVNTASRHDPMSNYAIAAFSSIAGLIPDHIPVILETLVDQGQSDIPTEIDRARRALESPALTAR